MTQAEAIRNHDGSPHADHGGGDPDGQGVQGEFRIAVVEVRCPEGRHTPHEELGDRQEKRTTDDAASHAARRPGPPPGEHRGRGGVGPALRLVEARAAAPGSLEDIDSPREEEKKTRQLRGGLAVEKAEPDPVDGDGEGVIAVDGDRPEVRQGLHHREGEAGDDRWAGEGKGNPPEDGRPARAEGAGGF